ncbi:MAG: helix-turn-helix transcriptional regulator [Gammaproteobacteria bacterium]|nr:helix-turn-helix transcriptional regulator [Gammaproteobacteria bacterium]
MPVDALPEEALNELPEFAERLRVGRQRLDMTQRSLSDAAGVPLQTHKQYERGLRKPGLDALTGYLRAGINVNWLLSGDGVALIRDIPATASVGAFDSRLMLELIEVVEQLLAEHGRELPPPKKAELIVTLYEMFRESASPVQRATVLRLVKLAA